MAETNILALPLTAVTVETSNNEDWIDSIVFLVDSLDPITGEQLDLRGIYFEMEVRRAPPLHEIILSASTKDGRLSIGSAPDYGYLIIFVPLSAMALQQPGAYVGDIRAQDDNYNRVCIQIDLKITEGITR